MKKNDHLANTTIITGGKNHQIDAKKKVGKIIMKEQNIYMVSSISPPDTY